MPPLPSTSASTSWRLSHVNGIWISVPHDLIPIDLVPKNRGSPVPMSPLPSTSALTSWRLLHFNGVWICVPRIDVSFPFLFPNNSTSHHEHTRAQNHITNTPTTPPPPPDPIAGDLNTVPNGDNNNTSKPPFIFLPHHPNTTKHHHQIISKTTLQITTHYTAKNMHDIQATVLHNFNKGTNILCLQEIPSNITLDNSPGLTTFENYAPDKTNGTAIIVHKHLAPFCPKTHGANIRSCLTTMDTTLPGYPTFCIFNIYKTHIQSHQQRLAHVITTLQQKEPIHLLIGDMNTQLQPHLDTDNIKHPKSWPWLYNQLHPPNPDTTPQLHDPCGSQNPHLCQWTRPRNKRLPDSQSRIDLIIASTSFISIFNPQNTFINTTIINSDHYPVTSTINIPTNQLNIYDIPHADIYYRKVNKEKHNKFLQRLHSLDTWTQNNMTSILNSPLDDLINITNNVLCSLVNSYKLVINQHHSHKPTKVEKAFTHQLNNIQPSTILTSKQAKTLQHTLDKWTEKKKRQSKKGLHHSLIKGWQKKNLSITS